ncbi:(2E,6E)-farnesyl diphosphate synthase [Shewanella sp. Choline-02u-19]|uniref:(2E,6E)-farnesyl diphosphate synthase n=1 Tax=unclassified Shewanella TaxID=196818 RepID=UPI000C33EE10|nr:MULTISPECIES: (2E,6E)-farnesyl diphosphate synthase [unclassified Shewanella]PKG58293.1 (2E,6E)-farnesyl diphosphate synthase [Shewanella sp. GutDb-MelDb]PKG75048.1 (2E,6E)-farnesyl diphosphate synthase [Shewanella sp. GutCb]PKH54861.1 (2E,6E)-farnesyl diphosphate synthase [Shewanella sp. Bg11-22]PKI26633.1 (2E,6E)-farnesyl diphosphate synthase [Shewanella sp. Choline-02u-19]
MLAEALGKYQQRINLQLSSRIDALADTDPRLKAAMKHGALIGGKRIRPFLVYAIGDMLKVKLETLDECAAAIECVHAYSLIHDDLPAMDNDALRRGQPTVHIAYDEATAILAGDALQALAFEIISEPIKNITPSQNLAMVKALANASGYNGMCGGQAMDLRATNKQIELATLIQLHQLKTGALIRCAVEFAIIAAQVNDEERQALLDFADAIGLAFQVQDDVLDIIASTEELGKPQGSDTDSNKSTYPKLLGLEGAQKTATSLIEDALSALAKLPYNSQLIAEFARYIIERRV